MNQRTRRVALYAIAAIAIAASMNALAHSYAGLYEWATHHRLGGWQARSWPAEIDVFLAVGELALYIAYLDGWPGRQRVWPWVTSLAGLAVSVAGNVGHVQASPGQPVLLTDRMTAAASPLAAFAGLSVGLLVVKMTRQNSRRDSRPAPARPPLVLAPYPAAPARAGSGLTPVVIKPASAAGQPRRRRERSAGPDGDLLRDASSIYEGAAARGERLSQRALARQLRGHGHRFPNQHLRQIAETIGLTMSAA